MHGKLRDLRLLYLAHEVEESFEGLERALHRHLPAELQAALQPLFSGGPGHERLEQQLAALSAEVEREKETVSTQDLLEAILDLERTAQDFYVRHAKELHDPGLRQLFEQLAHEEGRHAAAVHQAIALHGAKRGKRSGEPAGGS